MYINERLMAGELSAEVGTLVEDPGTVYLIQEWASPEAPKAYLSSPALAAYRQKVGLIGKPTALILSKK